MFEKAIQELTNLYQDANRQKLRLEKKHLDTPSRLVELEILELAGFLRGISKAIDKLESQRAETKRLL